MIPLPEGPSQAAGKPKEPKFFDREDAKMNKGVVIYPDVDAVPTGPGGLPQADWDRIIAAVQKANEFQEAEAPVIDEGPKHLSEDADNEIMRGVKRAAQRLVEEGKIRGGKHRAN